MQRRETCSSGVNAMSKKVAKVFFLATVVAFAAGTAFSQVEALRKGLDIKKTGLLPRYPKDRSCPPITSFYASWDDVDGSKRDEPHSGVDAGALGDEILAPGPGVIVAAWRANWGWGEEGAILIRHRREDLGLSSGAKFYYSEFDHLRYDEVRAIQSGSRVERGTPLATVFRPGGKSRYLPEVHWEVWQVEDDDATKWSQNEFGGRYWTNKSGRLIDPLYMLSLNAPANHDGSVDIAIFDENDDYAGFLGFTYIFPCLSHP
jgi:murein DD-endopeptidase MepM/ murein hydrolase activator NlpD